MILHESHCYSLISGLNHLCSTFLHRFLYPIFFLPSIKPPAILLKTLKWLCLHFFDKIKHNLLGFILLLFSFWSYKLYSSLTTLSSCSKAVQLTCFILSTVFLFSTYHSSILQVPDKMSFPIARTIWALPTLVLEIFLQSDQHKIRSAQISLHIFFEIIYVQ